MLNFLGVAVGRNEMSIFLRRLSLISTSATAPPFTASLKEISVICSGAAGSRYIFSPSLCIRLSCIAVQSTPAAVTNQARETAVSSLIS